MTNWVEFMKKVGIVCAALLALGTVVGGVSSWFWRWATTPIVLAIRDESRSRQSMDSLLVLRVNGNTQRISIIGESMQYANSERRREVLAKLKNLAGGN